MKFKKDNCKMSMNTSAEKDDTSALSGGDGGVKPSLGPVNTTNALVKNRPGK